MFNAPKRREIDHQMMKLLVGVIAISLACGATFLADRPLDSISASYFSTDTARNFFVGSLISIATFFVAYNGRTAWQMFLSRGAAFFAIGIAFVPCDCGHPAPNSFIHYTSAAFMFLILLAFCNIFRKRAVDKNTAQSKKRAIVYVLCEWAIAISIVVLGIYNILVAQKYVGEIFGFVWYFEALGLCAFGLSWLTASHILPYFNTPDERFRPFAGILKKQNHKPPQPPSESPPH